MGSDDLFKKRREARTQRKHEYKTTKANSYLIVTEGERTEPLYYAKTYTRKGRWRSGYYCFTEGTICFCKIKFIQ